MLIDVHAHFHLEGRSIPDAAEQNQNRLRFSRQWGIDKICASVLGTMGLDSPVYLPSLQDTIAANRRMAQIAREHPGFVYGYAYVNPNHGEKALDELSLCIEERDMIGLKLGASVKCTSPIVFPFIEKCIAYDVPLLHHVYQRRPGPTPNQDASDARELAELARRYPEAKIIHAHIGGGGDWEFGLRAAAPVENVCVDISGSGVDLGMMEEAVERLGPDRVLFATDVTMATGIAKLEALQAPAETKERIAYKNAQRLFGDRLQ
ncbi:MAG: amidohydrolase family protein [Planctomycetota bacterium]|jgi:predicted TIM-barrel fold metal-dependent hydrolase